MNGTFVVGDYECYLISIDYRDQTASVAVAGTFDILKAERAAFTVAKMLKCSSVTLERWGDYNRYTCRLDDVELKEIEKWLN